jgi:ankyrin repeat protein
VSLTGPDGTNALMYLMCHSPKDNREVYTSIMEKMKDRGLGVDNRNDFGETALHFAARHRNVTAVKKLIQLGASVNIPNKLNGSLPIHYALRRFSSSMAVTSSLIEVVKAVSAHSPETMTIEDVTKTNAKALLSSLNVNLEEYQPDSPSAKVKV